MTTQFKNQLLKMNLDYNFKIILEFFLALIIFSFFVFDFISLFKIITYLLGFIVVLEMIRMVIDFVADKSHVLKIRLVIDAFIIFLLRDVVLVISDEKYSTNIVQEKLLILIPTIFIFFIFRLMALKYSPNNKNCEECPSINHHSNSEKRCCSHLTNKIL